MDRINNLFNNKTSNIISVYFCAGAPIPDNTYDVIKSLANNGIDMVEIGVPFSDPLADGPIIQNASATAIKNGMTIRRLFAQLNDIRDTVTIPLIIMSYMNPIMQYGIENFFNSCKKIGIDGVIIPDLPFNEYMKCVKKLSEEYGVKVIMMITPETSDERIRQIDDNTNGFIYMVSSASVTGLQEGFESGKLDYFKRINSMNLKNHKMIGFGISNKATFDAAAKYSSGCIVGSLFVNLLKQEKENVDMAVNLLLKKLKCS